MRKRELLHLMAEGETVTVGMVDECIREEVERSDAMIDADAAYRDGMMKGVLLTVIVGGVMGLIGLVMYCLI